MLNYDIRLDTLGDDEIKLDLFSISSSDYFDDASKVEVRNEYTNDIQFYDGASVVVATTLERNDGYGNMVPFIFNDEAIVISHDNVEKVFTFIGEKYIPLNATSVTIEVEDGVLFLHFTFDSWHYYQKSDDYGIRLYATFTDSENVETVIVFDRCQYVMDDEVKWRYDASLEGIDSFMCTVFSNDKYEFVGYGEYGQEVDEKYVEVQEIPETACFTDELYLKKRVNYPSEDCWRYELYEKQCNDGSLFGISVKRENFRYQKVSITEEYFSKPSTSIPVPISLKTGNNTYQEQNIQENFVDYEVEKAKSKIVEMEKYVYHPVFKVVENDEITYKPIHKIKFNLHFRERSEDGKNGWIVKPDGYWNGMDANGVHGYTGKNNTKQFFSYNNPMFDDMGRQSDLLSYLDFNDTDVKYQKSKFKKSFLRLSFYDSKNRANQKLLAYATIFMDSGKLFAKMMRGANRKELYVISDQETSVRYDDLKVKREPCFDSNESFENVEEFRLSSQIVVTDRFSSKNSEGFYLYLWADNDKGGVPSDIYMKVEFNHAGYGRVIPFVLPYRKKKSASKMCTFKDVYDIWFPSVPGEKAGWSVKKNEEFSYIHFKYVYDIVNKKHVYYLDSDTYGMGGYYDDTPDELELCLYESKITFE